MSVAIPTQYRCTCTATIYGPPNVPVRCPECSTYPVQSIPRRHRRPERVVARPGEGVFLVRGRPYSPCPEQHPTTGRQCVRGADHDGDHLSAGNGYSDRWDVQS